jgi:hypothetical protein
MLFIFNELFYIELTLNMKTVEEYAKAGEHHDVMDALTLLTKAYISQCGISLGCRP